MKAFILWPREKERRNGPDERLRGHRETCLPGGQTGSNRLESWKIPECFSTCSKSICSARTDPKAVALSQGKSRQVKLRPATGFSCISPGSRFNAQKLHPVNP